MKLTGLLRTISYIEVFFNLCAAAHQFAMRDCQMCRLNYQKNNWNCMVSYQWYSIFYLSVAISFSYVNVSSTILLLDPAHWIRDFFLHYKFSFNFGSRRSPSQFSVVIRFAWTFLSFFFDREGVHVAVSQGKALDFTFYELTKMQKI